MRILKQLLRLGTVLLPWPLRRCILRFFFHYEIHDSAGIGFAWIFPRELTMEANTYIGHATVGINLDRIHLQSHSRVGKGNWITGFPGGQSKHFAHQPHRRSELVLGEHSAITNRHLIDCTGGVTLGKFTTFAGFQSQILSHSIDLEANRQSSSPIEIGDYCFIGTNCVLLGGSRLPDYSVLGAKSLLNKRQIETHTLYAGVPATSVKRLSAELKYFQRAEGFVV